MDEAQFVSYFWATYYGSSLPDSAHASFEVTNRSLLASLSSIGNAAHPSASSRFVFLSRLSPLLVVAAIIIVILLRLLGRRIYPNSKSSQSPTSQYSLFHLLKPFVTRQDVLQHRLASQPHRQQGGIDGIAGGSGLPGATSTSADSDTLLFGSEGFQRQRRRINRLLVVSLFQAATLAVASGWTLVHIDDAQLVSPLSQLCAWIIIFLRLLLQPPQTPTFDLVAMLTAVNVAAFVDLLSFVPLLDLYSGATSWNLSTLASILYSATNAAICVYAASLCLRMPVAQGGYEAVVDLDERLRHHTDTTDHNDTSSAHDMASTYRRCPTSPEDYCSLYENLSYAWMAPIQSLALRRSLKPTDVWRLRSINDTRLLFRKFKALERKPADGNNKPRLLSRILYANANDILLDACFKLVSVSFAYLGTYILKSILDEIQSAASYDDETADLPLRDDLAWSPRQKAFIYATIGLCLTVVRFLAELQNFHHARQVGLRLRSTLLVSLFEKALKRRDLSGQTKAPASEAGEQRSSNAELTGDHATAHHLSAAPSDSDPESESDVGRTGSPADASEHLHPHSPPSRSEVDDAVAARDHARNRFWTESLKVSSLKKLSLGSLRTSTKRQKARHSKEREERLKQQAEGQGADVGKIVNMMASDLNILLRMGCDLHQLYGAPLEVTIAAIFLYKLMGWSALVGFGILVAAIPVNYVWGEVAVKKQREYSSARDERMSLMTELIDAMRFVKIQGVEPQWEDRVTSARRTEIRRLVWSRIMTFLFELLWTTIPVLVTLVSFFFYVKVAQEELTVSVAFTAIALFTMIRPPLNAIPGFLMGGLIAMVSVQRLESFLNEQEVDEAVSRLSRQSANTLPFNTYKDEDDDFLQQSHHGATALVGDELAVKGCDFRWHGKRTSLRAASSSEETTPRHTHSRDAEHTSFSLRDIDVEFPARKLTLVIGPTGSGKSSLLAALLGEMLESKKDAIVRNKFDRYGNSRFSFASQLPWLEAGKSVRENVLFGTPYDKPRYETCIHACALQDDLDLMDDGDLTRIGSHTVSGGQKARIALARALYARADTVLLDDVLSAVDTRVQNHIVKHALLGPIAQGRRIVLVTHHVHLLADNAAFVVCMRHGKIIHKGTATDLQAEGVLPRLRVNKAEHDRSTSNTDSKVGSSQLERTSSCGDASVQETTPEPPVDSASGARTPRLLHQEEKRREGAVSWVFYRTYLQASSLKIWLLLVVFLLLLRLSESFGQYWLKVWGEAYKGKGLGLAMRTLTALRSHLPFNFPPANGHAGFYLTVYGLSGLAMIVFNSARAVCFYVASIRASQNLFATLLANVIRAPLRWFDVTPAGRIMNRFGTDMDCIDNILPQSIMNLGNNAFSMAAYFLICVVIVPAFLLPSALFVLLGPWLVGGFLACTRDLQRIEATSTSPVYEHFQQALSGIVTIRAFGAEPRLLDAMLDAVDLYQSLWWAICTMEVWLSFRSQILGGLSVFVVTLLALSGAVSPGSAGLALSSAQLLCQLAYYLVNDFKNLANSFNSLERVAEYQQMPREESQEIIANYSTSRVPAGWPSVSSHIVFENVSLRYAEDLPDVLRSVSFDVKPGEKVGIIGRTGSGKSSLASSLFRAVELSSGRILIDNIDIRTIPLHQLRSRLSIVMQDPVLFSGTVRENLDPFNEHDDAEVLDALRKVGLVDPLRTCSDESLLIDMSDTADPAAHLHAAKEGDDRQPSMRLLLDSPVSLAGANFSAGQAQLLSLARS